MSAKPLYLGINQTERKCVISENPIIKGSVHMYAYPFAIGATITQLCAEIFHNIGHMSSFNALFVLICFSAHLIDEMSFNKQ